MEQNDPYIIKINEIIQNDEQTKHLLIGLKNKISFETSFREYKLVAKPQISNPYELYLNRYHFTIIKNDKEILKENITPNKKIQKFKVTFNYNFEKDLVELNDNIIQLFEDAI